MKRRLPRSSDFIRFQDFSSLRPLCGQVLNAAAELGLPVIADEVYAGMSFSRHGFFALSALVADSGRQSPYKAL